MNMLIEILDNLLLYAGNPSRLFLSGMLAGSVLSVVVILLYLSLHSDKEPITVEIELPERSTETILK